MPRNIPVVLAHSAGQSNDNPFLIANICSGLDSVNVETNRCAKCVDGVASANEYFLLIYQYNDNDNES